MELDVSDVADMKQAICVCNDDQEVGKGKAILIDRQGLASNKRDSGN